MTRTRAMGMTLALCVLAACSGGPTNLTPAHPAAANAPVTGGSPSTTATRRVTATITLPRRKAVTSRAGKTRKYVSPSTLGLIVQVNTIVSGYGSTPYSYTNYDLTQNSDVSQCSQNQDGSATCTIILNAPFTSSTSSDAFYIYAYDQPQEVGATGSGYRPQGNLLAEDYDDVVPSSSGANQNGIGSNTNNTLTFTLGAIVATPEISYNTFEQAPLGTDTIVLSTTGDPATGQPNEIGATRIFNVDGYDQDANEIAAYDNPNGNNTYFNPILSSATNIGTGNNARFQIQGLQIETPGGPSGKYDKNRVRSVTKKRDDSTTTALTANTLGSSPDNDTGDVLYFPGTNDAPTSATSEPQAIGLITFNSSLNAGFGDANGNPTTQFSTSEQVVVAPMYSFVDSTVSAALPGTSGYIYAIAYAPASGANYTLTPAYGGDCTGYQIGTAQTTGLEDDQQAAFPVTIGTDTGSGDPCYLILSDGESQNTITLAAPSNATTTIGIPTDAKKRSIRK